MASNDKIRQEAIADDLKNDDAKDSILNDAFPNSLQQDEDRLANARANRDIAIIDAISNTAVQMIRFIIPMILFVIALCIIATSFVYTFFVITDYQRLQVFLTEAWVVFSCGSPLAVLLLLLKR